MKCSSGVTFESEVDDASGSGSGGGRRVVVVPGGVGIDANASARKHDEVVEGAGSLVAVVRIVAVEHGVGLRVHRLELFHGGLPGTQPEAALDHSGVLQPRPDRLQPPAVFQVGAVVPAHALTNQTTHKTC